MNETLERYDPSQWLVDGVVLKVAPPRVEKRLAKRVADWLFREVVPFAAAGFAVAMSVQTAGAIPNISERPLHVDARSSKKQDPDLVAPTYWKRLDAHLAKTSHVIEETEPFENPDLVDLDG